MQRLKRAVSSRNQYLSAQQKNDASCIYRSLQKAEQMISEGIKNAAQVISQIKKILLDVEAIKIEYVQIVDPKRIIGQLKCLITLDHCNLDFALHVEC